MKLLKFQNFIKEFKSEKKDQGSVVTIGNFDGCHLGHKKLLVATKSEAQRKGLKSIVLTFAPHPKQFFSPSSENQNIFTLEQKIKSFQELKLDLAIIQNFDQDFSRITHTEFYDKGLKEKLNAKTLILGKNFFFGAQKQGTIKWLEAQAQRNRVKLQAEPLQKKNEIEINSTQIKSFLRQGKVEQANQLLGHSFSIMGRISEGQKIGRTIGYPTANFTEIKQILPKKGVYCGYLKVLEEGSCLPEILSLPKEANLAVMNIGERPTIEGSQQKRLSVEAHIIGKTYHHSELYQKTCIFYFKSFLRDENKFVSLAALKKQIAKDIEQSIALSSLGA